MTNCEGTEKESNKDYKKYVSFSESLFQYVENYRRKQEHIPGFSEAIRQIVKEHQEMKEGK